MSDFTPPPSFLKASMARQAKLKKQMEEREKQRQSPPASVSPPTPSHAPPTNSNTLSQINKLQLARETRRAQQAQAKKLYKGLDQSEKDLLIFTEMLLKVKLKYENLPDNTSKSTENSSRNKDSKILVCVRKRPLNTKEISAQNFDIATAKTATYPHAEIYIHEPKIRVDMTRAIDTHKFAFDYLFDEHATNQDVYELAVKDLIDTMFAGGRVTLFAYGQTGSGKTHTIFGNDRTLGLYQSASQDIMEKLEQLPHLTITIRFFEIYGSKVFDLFNKRQRLELLEDGMGFTQVMGLTEIPVTDYHHFMELVERGKKDRTMGSTEANSESSRSHSVFQVTLYQENDLPQSPSMSLRNKSKSTSQSNLVAYQKLIKGQFSFVDLAGSERGSETGNASRKTRQEGADINKSLLALKECIRALHRETNIASTSQPSSDTGDGGHIPFRGSKLTQILRDSFTGKLSKTVMVATISPGSGSCEHTLNTLRYSDRVKELGRRRKSVVPFLDKRETSFTSTNSGSEDDDGDICETESEGDLLGEDFSSEEEEGCGERDFDDDTEYTKLHSACLELMMESVRKESDLLKNLREAKGFGSGRLGSLMEFRKGQSIEILQQLKEMK